MAAIDYETEYNNRARVPEHPEIFARWTREAEDYRRQAMQERRAELGLSYGSTPRQFIDLFAPGQGRQGAAGPVHPRRLLALARSVAVQPHGARAQRPRRHGRGRRLQSLPAGLDRRHHRGDAARAAVSLAAHRPARDGVRPFRRRPSRRRHAGDRLARALSQDPARPRARRLFDLRGVRSHPAGRGHDEPGPAARRGERARGLAAVLAGAQGPRLRRRRRRARIRASSCARARSSRKPGARTAPPRATRRSPAPTISP